MKKKGKILGLLLFLPLGLAYLLLLRCRKRSWPEGLRAFRYAHRGLHGPEAPENSLSAFRAALEHGYGAELDVHLMKDGNLAVIHDSSLLRTAGVDVRIEDLTKEELDRFPLKGSRERIPLLEEVLALFEDKAPLIIELKTEGGNHKWLTEAVCALTNQYRTLCCLESFDPRVLHWLKENRPDLIRGQLSGNLLQDASQSKPLLFALTQLLANAYGLPDFIAYDYKARRGCPGLYLCRLLYGAQEVSWTVRDRETAERLEKRGNLIIFENFTP